MNFRFIISLALFFFLNLPSNHRHTTEAAPTYLWHDCPNTTLFAPNSTYQSNLNTLVSSLSSAATHDADGFTNAAAGKDPPGRASGLFLCRGDISTATCSECVATGIKDVVRRCPGRRVSMIWYDECMLKYSDQSIFSAMEIEPVEAMPDAGNVADPDRFLQLLGETMNDAAERSSGSESGKKFAVVEANFTSSQKLYTIAQCTPDLTGSDCNTCLRAVIASLPQGKGGGWSFTPSCGLRFELYPFYNTSAVAAVVHRVPRLPSPPPAPLNRPKDDMLISVKSDVYSFGVLVLEIISGKKNSSFFQSDGGENLPNHAWKHWRAGTPLEVLDSSIGDSCSIDEVIRCLHIGLLGVQEDPADRPTMASIVVMLSRCSVKLPHPRQPAFFLQKSTERQLKELEFDESTGGSMPWSINEMSVTESYPR